MARRSLAADMPVGFLVIACSERLMALPLELAKDLSEECFDKI